MGSGGFGEWRGPGRGAWRLRAADLGSAGACLRRYQTDELSGGETLLTDIKAGASVMAELENGETAPGQILITYVLSWGHDSVDAVEH